MLYRTLGCNTRRPTGRPRSSAPIEIAEWDVVVIHCVRQNFYWRLTDDGLRDRSHRHGLESHVAEVFRVPRLVNFIVKICRLLERKDDAVDQDGDQANCHRRQRITQYTENLTKFTLHRSCQMPGVSETLQVR